MITEREFIGDNPNNKYVIFDSNNFEYIDPIKYYQEIFIRTSVSMMKAAVFSTEQKIPKKYLEESIIKRAIEDWLIEYNRIKEVNIPNSLTSLLLSQSKKEQLKLLKNSNLKSDEILAFSFLLGQIIKWHLANIDLNIYREGLKKKKCHFFMNYKMTFRYTKSVSLV